MKFYINFIIVIIYLALSESSLYANLKANLMSYVKPHQKENEADSASLDTNMMSRKWQGDEENDQDTHKADVLAAKSKARIILHHKNSEVAPTLEPESKVFTTQFYHMDPVLNVLRSNAEYRRRASDFSEDSVASQSSSLEMKDFKEEFAELWMHKKFEALNQTMSRGDQVNMVAARPWGVPCGDPAQHDMPWGTCMLRAECDAEFRIYRGDLFCGRTQFVCCGLRLTNYDMYQGFDLSFEGKSISTDSDEKRDQKMGSREKKKRKREQEKKKRRKGREARKKKIRRHIKNIINEIKKILNRQFKNGTKMRKKRTKQLKKFIKDLKKQYKKDRQSVKDLHEEEMIKIDNNLQSRLLEIKTMNQNFVKNTTFREILVNGTITKKAARMLLEAYPELTEFLEARRDGGGDDLRRRGDNLDYDVEYGYLYY